MVLFWFFSSEKDVYVGYLPLAHVLELIAGNVGAKEKIAILFFCGFCFLALMRFEITFDVTMRDDSSFGKLTNWCKI